MHMYAHSINKLYMYGIAKFWFTMYIVIIELSIIIL